MTWSTSSNCDAVRSLANRRPKKRSPATWPGCFVYSAPRSGCPRFFCPPSRRIRGHSQQMRFACERHWLHGLSHRGGAEGTASALSGACSGPGLLRCGRFAGHRAAVAGPHRGRASLVTATPPLRALLAFGPPSALLPALRPRPCPSHSVADVPSLRDKRRPSWHCIGRRREDRGRAAKGRHATAGLRVSTPRESRAMPTPEETGWGWPHLRGEGEADSRPLFLG
jgi:hypothetical protein